MHVPRCRVVDYSPLRYPFSAETDTNGPRWQPITWQYRPTAMRARTSSMRRMTTIDDPSIVSFPNCRI